MVESMTNKTYAINVQPEGRFLLISFPDHPELYTQAEHPREIDLMAKDIIYLRHGIPVEQIELEVFFVEEERESTFINKVRSFLKLSALHPAPSADGQ